MTLLFRYLNISLLLIIITSCTVKINSHGYVFDEVAVKSLKKGMTTKQQVIESLGTPSTKSDFNKNIWYYISNKTKQISMLKPKNIEEKILQVSFKANKVNNVIIYHDDKVRELIFSPDETPVKGDDTGMVKDFMQNLGRFNKSRVRK